MQGSCPYASDAVADSPRRSPDAPIATPTARSPRRAVFICGAEARRKQEAGSRKPEVGSDAGILRLCIHHADLAEALITAHCSRASTSGFRSRLSTSDQAGYAVTRVH